MFSIVLLLLSIVLPPSQPALTFTAKHPIFSSHHSDRVFAGAGGEAVLHCQVSQSSSSVLLTALYPPVLLSPSSNLPCQVDNLGQHTVSWTRQKDLQILTVGSHKFSTDQRISVTFDQINTNFMLVIRGLGQQDFGNYECQINSNPVKIRVVSLARPVITTPPPPPHLTKLAAKPASLDIPDHSGSITNIVGAPDIYFRQGSLVNITCVVNSLKRPEHIFWYHDGQVISYYSARGGISIVREEGLVENESRSTIILRDGDQSDQGTYTCRPLTGDFKSATTRLFLLSAGGSSTENNCQIFPVLLSSLLSLLSILL